MHYFDMYFHGYNYEDHPQCISPIFPKHVCNAARNELAYLGGPMGGIVGGMDIKSKGEYLCWVYPFLIG